MSDYQEQIYLIDPFLERMVTPIIEVFKAHAVQYTTTLKSETGAQYSSIRLTRLTILLYTFIKSRGRKTIGKRCLVWPEPEVEYHQSISSHMRLPIFRSHWTISLLQMVPLSLSGLFDTLHFFGFLWSAWYPLIYRSSTTMPALSILHRRELMPSLLNISVEPEWNVRQQQFCFLSCIRGMSLSNAIITVTSK